MKCKICQERSDELFKLKVLNKYQAAYFRCAKCGFVQTEHPYWLEEAYRVFDLGMDTGALQRNLDLKIVVGDIIRNNFDPTKKFLDFGGGYGVLVRLMRDSGFDFYRYDKFCQNIFARYFDVGDDPGKTREKFELVTAVELFEHLVDPLPEIKKMFDLGDSIFFTTELLPQDISDLKKWWYFCPETAQHVSFYSRKSLETVAEKYCAQFYTSGSYHFMTRRKMRDPFGGIMSSYGVFKVLKWVRGALWEKHHSLAWKDHEHIKRILYRSK